MPDALELLALTCRDAELSPRQTEAYTLAAQGLGYYAVGRAMGIRPKTAHRHLMEAKRRVKKREEERKNMEAVVEWSRERRASSV